MVNPMYNVLKIKIKHYKENTMSQLNDTTYTRVIKHLTERNRYTIEDLLKERYSTKQIANRLNKSVRTIQREIKRGKIRQQNSDLTFRDEYLADYGQLKYYEASRNKGPELKIGRDIKLSQYIEDKIIIDGWSPGAVLGHIKAIGKAFEATISIRTLYNYIDRGDVFLKLTNKHLPVKKDGQKRTYNKVRNMALKNIKGTSIEDRPPEIDDRKEYGHWEMDCVVGRKAGGGPVLLVLSERSTREELIFKIAAKKQEFVLKAIDKIERKHGKEFMKKFKSITMDNGCEFLNWEELERSKLKPGKKRLKTYYAHPYSSWERGTNENTNKLIRRFIPKGTDIGQYPKKQIQYIQDWINNYPRKIFGYKTAADMVILATC